jgi:hypothetical protein
MDRREFWSTKSPLPEYHAIRFEHPAFDAPIRLVANQFADVTLGGHVHTPAPMTIKPPDQASSDARPRLQIAFPRAVVGREFKRKLGLIVASGSREPITVAYEVYLGSTDAPQLTWALYVSDQGGVAFGAESVQVTATDDNPLRRAVAPIYRPDEFTGLELI